MNLSQKHHPQVRTAAKALIIKDQCLLAIAKRDHQGIWYILPGGGQQHGETLQEALLRECLEEIGTLVKIGKLLFVRECIGKNHSGNGAGLDDWFRKHHGIDFIFACSVPDTYTAQSGTLPDDGQEKVEWLPIDSLSEYRLFPSTLPDLIANHTTRDTYIGDVN
jgi:8-oxo-dGTP diphosphatase